MQVGFMKVKAMNKWKQIETAPKDKLILLYRPDAWDWGKVAPGAFNRDEYAKKPKPYWEIWLKVGTVSQAREWKPTHWMELPDAPKGERHE